VPHGPEAFLSLSLLFSLCRSSAAVPECFSPCPSLSLAVSPFLPLSAPPSLRLSCAISWFLPAREVAHPEAPWRQLCRGSRGGLPGVSRGSDRCAAAARPRVAAQPSRTRSAPRNIYHHCGPEIVFRRRRCCARASRVARRRRVDATTAKRCNSASSARCDQLCGQVQCLLRQRFEQCPGNRKRLLPSRFLSLAGSCWARWRARRTEVLIEGSSASSRRLVGEPHVGERHARWWPAGRWR
jgi:hypothetical protein